MADTDATKGDEDDSGLSGSGAGKGDEQDDPSGDGDNAHADSRRQDPPQNRTQTSPEPTTSRPPQQAQQALPEHRHVPAGHQAQPQDQQHGSGVEEQNGGSVNEYDDDAQDHEIAAKRQSEFIRLYAPAVGAITDAVHSPIHLLQGMIRWLVPGLGKTRCAWTTRPSRPILSRLAGSSSRERVQPGRRAGARPRAQRRMQAQGGDLRAGRPFREIRSSTRRGDAGRRDR